MNFKKFQIYALLVVSTNSYVYSQDDQAVVDSQKTYIEQTAKSNFDEFVQILAIPERTKEIYLAHDETDCRYHIIKRCLFCLSVKWKTIGRNALVQTPGSIKELHYIVTGDVCEELADLSVQVVGQELCTFFELFVSMQACPFTEYERQQIMQSAAQKYVQELSQKELWEAVRMQVAEGCS